MNKALEILEYFAAEHMAYNNTPFLLHEFDEAIAELEAMEARIKELEENLEIKTRNCDILSDEIIELNRTLKSYKGKEWTMPKY